MFERYTEKARRTIFFARYEASQAGSTTIESEHLLLGLLREDQGLTRRVGLGENTLHSVRAEIEREKPAREKIETSVELPLSDESKRILACAAEESERMADSQIGTEHLLLGILRESNCLAARILNGHGVQLEEARERLVDAKKKELSAPPGEGSVRAARLSPSGDVRTERPERSSLLSEFVGDVGHDAAEGKLDPLIGREAQLDRVVEILCMRSRNNPVLVGEAGVGKSALVEGLALRIEAGEVPERLQGKRILTFDLGSLVAVLSATRLSEERMRAAMQELERMKGAIVYIEGLFAGATTPNLPRILKPPLDRAEIQCLAAALPAEFRKWTEREPWLNEHFYAVEIPAPSEADAIKILHTIKNRYAMFHGVAYSDEAIEHAVYYSQKFLPKGHLPDKAIDLIDEAGAAVAVHRDKLPREVAEVQKRLKAVMARLENAIACHEFEKARGYSEAERKEREKLRALEQKYRVGAGSSGAVGVEEIEDVLSRWTNIPVETIRQERRKA
jgi:ATP-dependent Clp protease ATP-binding subunit ClpC